MTKVKFLLWIAIILTTLTMAGCTGTKTAMDTGHMGTAMTSAADYYHAKVNDLKQQIDEIRTIAQPDNNSTLVDYQRWLDQYQTSINDTWDQYNLTVQAGNTYLLQLDNTSDEYRSVTSDLDVFKNDLNGLESNYQQMVARVETYKEKLDALNKYKDALNATSVAYTKLANLGGTSKINSMSDYSSYVGQYKLLLNDYDARCNDAIDAGHTYQQFCDPQSAEYAGIAQNENALKDGMSKAQASYDKLKADVGTKYNTQAVASDYTSKMDKVTAAKADLDKYSSASALEKLNYDYVIGYRQKVTAFDSICNDAISSGDSCLQYLDKSSTQYKTVTDNKNAMEAAMTQYHSNLDQLITMYNNLHMLDPIK